MGVFQRFVAKKINSMYNKAHEHLKHLTSLTCYNCSIDTGLGTHSIGFYFLLMGLNFCGIFIHCVGDDNIGSVSFSLVYLCIYTCHG